MAGLPQAPGISVEATSVLLLVLLLRVGALLAALGPAHARAPPPHHLGSPPATPGCPAPPHLLSSCERAPVRPPGQQGQGTLSPAHAPPRGRGSCPELTARARTPRSHPPHPGGLLPAGTLASPCFSHQQAPRDLGLGWAQCKAPLPVAVP